MPKFKAFFALLSWILTKSLVYFYFQISSVIKATTIVLFIYVMDIFNIKANVYYNISPRVNFYSGKISIKNVISLASSKNRLYGEILHDLYGCLDCFLIPSFCLIILNDAYLKSGIALLDSTTHLNSSLMSSLLYV